MRYLEEMGEAVGNLLAVGVYENTLLVIMDSAQFAVDFPSTKSLRVAKEGLSAYIGKKVAMLRDTNAIEPLRIRLVAQRCEATIGGHEN